MIASIRSQNIITVRADYAKKSVLVTTINRSQTNIWILKGVENEEEAETVLDLSVDKFKCFDNMCGALVLPPMLHFLNEGFTYIWHLIKLG
jgi:hypothetical protein